MTDSEPKIRNTVARPVCCSVPDPMTRGYRSVVLAAVGWLIAAASPEQQRMHPQKQDSSAAIASVLQTTTRASVKPVSTSEYDRPCKKGEQDRKSSLCAEWQSADEAEEASKWAARSVWVSLAGIFALLYSLRLTRRATKVAADAAAGAERSLQFSRESFESENRPILIPDGMEFFQLSDECWRGCFRWKNAGRFTAVLLNGYTSILVVKDGDTENIIERARLSNLRFEERARSKVALADDVFLSEKFFLYLKDIQKGFPVVFCRIEYESAVGTEKTTWYSENAGGVNAGIAIKADQQSAITLTLGGSNPDACGIISCEFKSMLDGIRTT